MRLRTTTAARPRRPSCWPRRATPKATAGVHSHHIRPLKRVSLVPAPPTQQRRQGVPRIGQRRQARAEDEQADAAVTPEWPHQWAAVDRVPGTASSRDRVVTPWILAL